MILYLAAEVQAGAGAGLTVSQPLPAAAIRATGRLQLPEDAGTWAERSLLQDLIDRYELPPSSSARSPQCRSASSTATRSAPEC